MNDKPIESDKPIEGDGLIEFTIIVNGQPVPIKIDIYAEIREAIVQALDESGNSGQPIDNWELRDASGQPIDTGKKISEAGFTEDTKLFLSLKAGVGGTCG